MSKDRHHSSPPFIRYHLLVPYSERDRIGISSSDSLVCGGNLDYHHVESCSCVWLVNVILLPSTRILIARSQGASGITGWAIVKAILDGYPTEDTFASITALTNRPLSLEDALWTKSPKLDVVSGIDLLTSKGQEGLEAELKAAVQHSGEITHVYFFGMPV
jgi:hypothetical protein